MDLKVWIKRLFGVSAIIACFTCYARPDYNLVLFAFAYLLWDQPKPSSQKIRLIYLIIFTAIFDLVWLFYWWSFWDKPQFDTNWAKGIQSFVLVLSLINFFIKIAIIGICWYTERECKEALGINGFKNNVIELIQLNSRGSYNANNNYAR